MIFKGDKLFEMKILSIDGRASLGKYYIKFINKLLIKMW